MAKLRSIMAEIGLSLFVSLGIFTLVSAGLEMIAPGWLTDHLPPQVLVVVLIACGAAALLGERERPSRRAKSAYAAAGAAVTVLVALAVWSSFSAMPEARLGLAAAAVLAAGAAFWVAIHPDLGAK